MPISACPSFEGKDPIVLTTRKGWTEVHLQHGKELPRKVPHV